MLDGGPDYDTLKGQAGYDECYNGEANSSCEVY
jgi:hypothetical protein